MKLIYLPLACILFLTTVVYAEEQNPAQTATLSTTLPTPQVAEAPDSKTEKNKPIEIKNATGEVQTTIIDEQGNLKIADPKTKPATQPADTANTVPAKTATN